MPLRATKPGHRQILEEFEEKARREYVPAIALALAHMAVGDLDGTFAWLDKMYEERAPELIFMNVHARYDRLRGDPRFQQLLRKIGFKELKFIPEPLPTDPPASRSPAAGKDRPGLSGQGRRQALQNAHEAAD